MKDKTETHGLEWEVFRLLLRQYIQPEFASQITELLAQPVDWDYLLSFIAYHRVGSLIYTIIKRDLPGVILENVESTLRKSSSSAQQRRLRLATQLVYLLKLFDANHVDVMPLKGALLDHILYGNQSLRSYYDLDLLVHKQDIPRVKGLLGEAGFAFAPEVSDQEDILLRSGHELSFFHRENGIKLELHWNLMPKHFSTLTSPNLLWDEASKSSLWGEPISMPKRERLFEYISIHSAHHVWSRFSLVCDVGTLIKVSPDLDWDFILAHSRRLRSQRIILTACALTHELLGTPLPETITRLIAKDEAVQSLYRQFADNLYAAYEVTTNERQTFLIRSRESWIDQLIFLATPNTRDRLTLKLPSYFDFLYYAVRPLRLLRDQLPHD